MTSWMDKDSSWFDEQAALEDLWTLRALRGEEDGGGAPPAGWPPDPKAKPLEEHLGPGPHPSGSDQQVHGGTDLPWLRDEGEDFTQGHSRFWHDPKEHEPPSKETIANRRAFIEIAGGPQLLELESDGPQYVKGEPYEVRDFGRLGKYHYYRVPDKAALIVRPGGPDSPEHVSFAFVMPAERKKGLIHQLFNIAEERHGTLAADASDVSAATAHNLAYKQPWRPMYYQKGNALGRVEVVWYEPGSDYLTELEKTGGKNGLRASMAKTIRREVFGASN